MHIISSKISGLERRLPYFIIVYTVLNVIHLGKIFLNILKNKYVNKIVEKQSLISTAFQYLSFLSTIPQICST